MTRPANPIALNLARIVHRLLTEPRGWRLDLLKSDLGIADRTYRKYRGLLRDHLEHELAPDGDWTVDEVDEGEARYLRLRRASGAAEDHPGFLGRLAGFWLARRLFEFSGDSDLRDAVEGGWAEFVAGIKDKPFYLGHLLRHSDRMLHFIPDAPKDYSGKEEHIARLLRALFYSRMVEVDYRAISEDKLRSHLLCPLTLLMWKGGLYVVASHSEGGKPYLFAIDRLEEVRATKRRFRYPDAGSYSPSDYFAGAFGIFHAEDGSDVRVEARFAAKPWLARYLRERTWHPSQVFTEDKQGRVILTMDLNSLEEVAPWLRSFGRDVEVLAPAALVGLVKA